MNNREIASMLDTIGTLLELTDDNSFRSNAYYAAGRRIESLSEPLKIADLQNFPGVGKALQEKISEMITKGHSPYLDSLRAEVPPGLLELLRIQGLGPKRVRALWRELGITSLEDLERACDQDRLKNLKGFGQKLQEKIVQGLTWIKKFAETYLLGEGAVAGRDLMQHLARVFHVKQFAVVGSVRRGCELVHNLDVVSSLEDPDALIMFLQANQYVQAIEKQNSSVLAKLSSGLALRVQFVSERSLGAATVFWTGSRGHVDRLMARAKERGLEFSREGLKKNGKLLDVPGEADCYKRLDLPYIEPELREDTGEIEAAESGRLPKLVSRSDLAGTVHVHSTWSDGANTLEDMVAEAASMGFKFVGITDHSRSATYANGLSVERLHAQAAEIADVQKKYPGIRILRGTECDILPDGSMDFPQEELKNLDLVVASIHSQMQMPKEEMTGRVIRALENPYVDVLGHPTGRLLMTREAIQIDLDRVLDAVKKNEKVIEINANPHRLDIETTWIRAARDKGVIMSIDPDAHNRVSLTDVDYGVVLARRGWVSRETILNAGDPDKALGYFKRNR